MWRAVIEKYSRKEGEGFWSRLEESVIFGY